MDIKFVVLHYLILETNCPHCFDEWKESTIILEDVLGKEINKLERKHMTYLEGMWHPPREEGVVEQQGKIYIFHTYHR